MATITIPFPSTETLLGPELARAASIPQTTIKSVIKKQPGYKKQSIRSKALKAVVKPKQTKSRNGCHTCKEKRLKCDETKPGCDQCKKRKVLCGGYNKIFQWRPEEKATFRASPAVKGKKQIEDCIWSPVSPKVYDQSEDFITKPDETAICFQPPTFLFESPTSEQEGHIDTECPDQDGYADVECPDQYTYDDTECRGEIEEASLLPEDCITQHFLDEYGLSGNIIGDEEEVFHEDEVEPWLFGVGYPLGLTHSSAFETTPLHNEYNDIVSCRQRPSTLSYGDCEMLSTIKANGYPSPSLTTSSSSSSSSDSSILSLTFNEPVFNPFSTEMLIARFVSETCGILSIKDGHNENPWKTMLLPMSFGVPALHHAILCLSAFHASRQDKRFRITGLMQMQKSISYLSSQLNTMRRDTALATTLVLAFSESWNEETSTGIRHLKGARALVTQAIANHKVNADFEEMERLKFLRNTWVYMDVIARITALDDDDLENLDALFAPVYGPDSQVGELDPLMGCAWALFPLLGKVANLVREIRRTTGNSLRIVSKAAALKVDILNWMPPTDLQVPQDQSIEVAHTLSTAEAYRWSALLFLYQAVPMIATEPIALLAEKILFHLFSVPLTSRVIIIQIFPLLVAGCEVASEEDRLLVRERWESMTQRMTIGNLDRCSDVVHEVWSRRDELAPLKRNQIPEHNEKEHELQFSTPRSVGLNSTTSRPNVARPAHISRQSSDSNFNIDFSATVRGYGHWLTVMEDWEWAVLLG